MTFDKQALRAAGIDLDDTTSTGYTIYDPATGDVVQTGIMGWGALRAHQHAGNPYLIGQLDPAEEYVDLKTKTRKPLTKAMKAARAAPKAQAQAAVVPMPEGVPLIDFIMAVYWEKKGDLAPMRKWIADMDADLAKNR